MSKGISKERFNVLFHARLNVLFRFQKIQILQKVNDCLKIWKCPFQYTLIFLIERFTKHFFLNFFFPFGLWTFFFFSFCTVILNKTLVYLSLQVFKCFRKFWALLFFCVFWEAYKILGEKKTESFFFFLISRVNCLSSFSR